MKKDYPVRGVLLALSISALMMSAGLVAETSAEDEKHIAQNVILLIGDGMGHSQVTAARMEKASWNLTEYASTDLFMDKMDYCGYVTTYSSNSFVTDSAPAATAMATGQKTDNGVISQDSTATTKVMDGKNLTTILELAEEKGLSTGLVTTTRITHATPAAFYAHVNDRDNEAEIANQLIQSGVEVALGGGLSYFVDKNETDPLGGNGRRADDRNLIEEAEALGYTFVYNGTAFRNLNATETEKLLGLFDSSHMLYEKERLSMTDREPSLAEMTEMAIAILSGNSKGFFLMVEGGRIDHAGHERSLRDITMDTLAFDEAVKAALDFALMSNDTLVIVTADHECGGLVLQPENLDSYEGGGVNPIFGSGTTKTVGPRYDFITEMEEATHTAVDVPIMASGPGAESVSRGRLDNTQIFNIMRESLGI
jgi:alkaline phosphatase